MKILPLVCAAAFFTIAAGSSQAAVILFNLQGVAGSGLLPGNEPGTVTGGTGGEIGAGVTFDDVSNILSVRVGWGSAHGFTNLTSDVTLSHIHGPTTANFGFNGTSNFTQTAGVQFNLTRSGNSATGGTIIQDLTLSAAQETDLLNGKYYINIHTATNGGGEIRGFLVAVPEPSGALLGAAGLGLLAWRRQRQA